MKRNSGLIKCVVWDLDHTIWDGVLLEDERVRLRADIEDVIKTLDGRGLLQSIASRNDYGKAIEKLREFGLCEYFIYPQISWNSKAESVKRIAESINIAPDSIAFVDDQPFERDEVNYLLPEVLCIDAAHLDRITGMPEMHPRFITEDSRNRRLMYISDIERKKDEEEFVGPKAEFLASLNMIFTVAPATEDDLKRAEELTVRTHQLNTTGYTYSYEELDGFRQSPNHLLLIASLEDRYGSYGKIGLALVECLGEAWTIKLLLMSCRVISRGVGSTLLNLIMRLARDAGVRLRAELVPNGRNRMMYVTHKFAGFKEVDKVGEATILESDLTRIQGLPDFVTLRLHAPVQVNLTVSIKL